VLSPFTLTPFPDPTGLAFTWQDNTHQSTFTVTDFGKYWVTVSNGCVSHTDTIRFTKAVQQVVFLPNVITPNGDSFNQYFKVDDSLNGNVNLKVINRWGKEVYQSSNYKNNWDGGDLDPGTYYVLISGGCLPAVVKEWVTIIR
jgi:gliding motility-associated-like protein